MKRRSRGGRRARTSVARHSGPSLLPILLGGGVIALLVARSRPSTPSPQMATPSGPGADMPPAEPSLQPILGPSPAPSPPPPDPTILAAPMGESVSTGAAPSLHRGEFGIAADLTQGEIAHAINIETDPMLRRKLVAAFQRGERLTVHGWIDPETRAAMARYGAQG